MKSIMGYDERFCPKCGSRATDWHHLIGGNTGRRKLSEKYGLKIKFCHSCHMDLHDRDSEGLWALKKEAQEAFEEHYPNLNFLSIFGRNYK